MKINLTLYLYISQFLNLGVDITEIIKLMMRAVGDWEVGVGGSELTSL